VKPRLSRKARVRPDPRDGRPVLLSPERGLRLSVEAIVDALAERYAADRARIAADAHALLAELRARALIEDADDEPGPPGAMAREQEAAVVASASEASEAPEPARPLDGFQPYTLVAELTHRCALACPYCSNPEPLVRGGDEMRTDEWTRVVDEAAALGVMQVHLTGGEPLARSDLEAIAARARARDLYVNLVTSGVPLDRARLERLAPSLDHVQLSVQDADPASSDDIAGLPSHAAKMRVGAWVKELGLPLTVNVVLHRANLDRVEAVVAMAERLGADRLELANVQLVSWALANADALLPTRSQIDHARAVAQAAKARLRGRMEVVFVLPDWLADRPRACMDGWARRFVVVAPDGVVLPCHAARSLPLAFETVRDGPLARVWSESPGLRAFRGESWMPEPCRGCDRRELDFGGCRCQAFALTGDAGATDPACAMAPMHAIVRSARERAERAAVERRWVYRGR
jgi:pyrroloquinoline quinone biosynthesis protein E